MFGPTVSNAFGEVTVSRSLDNRAAVGVLFAASWDAASVVLVENLALQWESANNSGQRYQIVWVSYDFIRDDYINFFTPMPTNWLSIGFQSPKRFLTAAVLGIRGLPAVVVLGSDGTIITHRGGEYVKSDPYAVSFPWRQPPVWDIIEGAPLVTGDGTEITWKTIYKQMGSNKLPDTPVIAIYFGAHWNRECRIFVPKLAEARTLLSEKWCEAYGYMIVYASSDTVKEEHDDVVRKHDLLSLGFRDTRVMELGDLLGGITIPSIVVINYSGFTVTKFGVDPIISKKPSDYQYDVFPWNHSVEDLVTPYMIDSKGSRFVFSQMKADADVFVMFYAQYKSVECRHIQKLLSQGLEKIASRPSNKLRTKTIYISEDASDDEFNLFFENMHGWLSFPRDFGGFRRKYLLVKNLGVRFTPMILVFNLKLQEITRVGVEMLLYEDPEFETFPWENPYSVTREQQGDVSHL